MAIAKGKKEMKATPILIEDTSNGVYATKPRLINRKENPQTIANANNNIQCFNVGLWSIDFSMGQK